MADKQDFYHVQTPFLFMEALYHRRRPVCKGIALRMERESGHAEQALAPGKNTEGAFWGIFIWKKPMENTGNRTENMKNKNVTKVMDTTKSVTK